MKKALLYIFFLLFIAGLATFAYGFWNAKNIRLWAVAVEKSNSSHDTSAKEKDIVDSLNALGGKKSGEFKDALNNFRSNLDSISSEMESARGDIEKMSTPRTAKPLKSEIIDYYSQGSQQVKELSSTVEFLNQVFDATVVFDNITPDSNIEEIKKTIAEAKAKSDEIDPEVLPDEMKNLGSDLKTTVFNYLDAFDQYASEKVEDHSQLDASYADFSQKEKDFWEARKKLSIYTNAKEMDSLGAKINGDLMVLKKVKFSIK